MFSKFFGVPQAVIRLGIVRNLSGVTVKVYMALLHDSERYQTRELVRTVRELIELVGGSPNSHKKARDELRAAGLWESEERGTEGFLFRLCDPETGKPWPGGPKEKITYQKKAARQAGTPIVNQPDSSSSRWPSAAAGRTDRSAVEASALRAGNNRRSATRLTRDSLPVSREIDQTEIESTPSASERTDTIPRGLESPYAMRWADISDGTSEF